MKTAVLDKKLGDVVAVQSGFAFKSSEYSDRGHFLIRIANVQDGYLSLGKPKYVALDAKTKKFELRAGDIVTSLTGNVGRVAKVEPKHLPAALNQRVARLVPKPDAGIDAQYLLRFLHSSTFSRFLEERAHGAAQANVSPSVISEVPIPLPPLKEQQRIVAVLDEAFEGLSRARAHAEANLQNARVLFDEAEAKLFQDIFLGSTETTLGELASFRNGLNYSRTSQGEEVKVVGVGDFQDNFLIPKDTLSVTKIDGQLADDDKLVAGDILAVRSNGNRELIGRTMLMPEPDEPTSFSGFTIRIRLEDKNILPEYVCSYLRTKDSRAKLTAGGGGANISNLNQRILSSFPISYPEKSGQRNALDYLEKLRESSKQLHEGYTAKLQDLDDLRQSLLQKAFVGELT